MPKTWFHSTHFFRTFREKHTLLSQLYWTAQLGVESVRTQLTSSPTKDFAVDVIHASFSKGMLPDTCAELLSHLEERQAIQRLHLLVICSANLEAYVKDVTELLVGAMGHIDSEGDLTAVGKALARPILQSNTLTDILGYAEHLYQISLEPHLGNWKRAYKLRCAAAHNGGRVTPRTLREIPDIGLPLGAIITLDWPTLKQYLDGADEIAALIDRTAAKENVLSFELQCFVRDWKKIGLVPDRKAFWTELQRLGFGMPKKARRREIETLAFE